MQQKTVGGLLQSFRTPLSAPSEGFYSHLFRPLLGFDHSKLLGFENSKDLPGAGLQSSWWTPQARTARGGPPEA